jgi:hypothetical protein
MNRNERIRGIEAAIGRRKLVWFGTRGADASPLLDIAQFSDCFSLIAPLASLALRETCLETLTNQRVDLDSYTIDLDQSAAATQLHAEMLRCLSQPSVVALYRPSAFFASVHFPRIQTVEYLGLFHERQAAFEHKPWVETELQASGVRVIPWRYFPDEDQERVLEALEGEPLVLRTTRSDGGAGLRIVRQADELLSHWPAHSDRFVAAAPYFSPSIPLNVGGCVFRDGSVSLHGPSLQLIGVPELTDLALGYCGNDFAAIRDLDDRSLDDLEEIVLGAGAWLARNGYVGAFGVDALIYEGQVYLSEVNARFQGSSAMSADIDRSLERPDIYLNHVAAFLGQAAPAAVPLRELARQAPALSHLIVHNRGSQPLQMRPDAMIAWSGTSDGKFCWHSELVPSPNVAIYPGAALFRVVREGQATRDGFSLLPGSSELASHLMATFQPRSTVSLS